MLILVSLAVFLLAALTQAVTGFGSALVAVPLLGVVTGPVDSVVAATVVSLVLTAGGWRRERQHVDVTLARTLFFAGLAGLPAGLLLLTVLDRAALGVAAAAVVVVAVPLLVLAPDLRPGPRAAGVVSGVLLAGSGMNGPPLVLALRHLEPRAFRSTLQAVFCGQDAIAVLAFAALGLMTADVVVVSAAGLTVLAPGWAVGDKLFHAMRPRRLRRLVLLMLLASAVTSGAVHLGLVSG